MASKDRYTVTSLYSFALPNSLESKVTYVYVEAPNRFVIRSREAQALFHCDAFHAPVMPFEGAKRFRRLQNKRMIENAVCSRNLCIPYSDRFVH
jgi:hypothetical protein